MFPADTVSLESILVLWCLLCILQTTKKLVGDAEDTIGWSTNVGNERGEILMSVMKVSEGSGILTMTQGLVKW